MIMATMLNKDNVGGAGDDDDDGDNDDDDDDDGDGDDARRTTYVTTTAAATMMAIKVKVVVGLVNAAGSPSLSSSISTSIASWTTTTSISTPAPSSATELGPSGSSNRSPVRCSQLCCQSIVAAQSSLVEAAAGGASCKAPLSKRAATANRRRSYGRPSVAVRMSSFILQDRKCTHVNQPPKARRCASN